MEKGFGLMLLFEDDRVLRGKLFGILLNCCNKSSKDKVDFVFVVGIGDGF